MMELPGRQRSLTISSAVWMECTNVTDRRSRDGTGRQQWPRLRIASRGKTGRPYISFRKSWFSHFLTLWPWDLQNRASRGVAALCQVCFDWLLRFGHSVVVTCNGRVTIMVCSFWVVLADSGGERWPHRRRIASLVVWRKVGFARTRDVTLGRFVWSSPTREWVRGVTYGGVDSQ